MAWARFDDQFDENDHVLSFSDAEFRLYVCSITATHRWKSRGFISEVRAKSLARKHGVALKTIDHLVANGRWESVPDGGFQVHDSDDYAPKVDHNERSEAGKKGARARWKDGSPIAQSHKPAIEKMAHAGARAGTPVPEPVKAFTNVNAPDLISEQHSENAGTITKAYCDAYQVRVGMQPTPAKARAVGGIVKRLLAAGRPPTWVRHAALKTVQDGISPSAIEAVMERMLAEKNGVKSLSPRAAAMQRVPE